jgi:hypothetical protein
VGAFVTARMIARARREARHHASLVMTDALLPRANPSVGLLTSGLRSSPLHRLAISGCPLGQLLRTREHVRLPMIIDYEEFYANQQRDHRSGLREYGEG